MNEPVCNCPSLRSFEVAGTKEPCPVHGTPEFLAKLADQLIPAFSPTETSEQ